MPTTLKSAAESYLRAKALSRGTRNEYLSTLRKWERWGGGLPVEQLRRKDIREFLDWVHEQAVKDEGENPGRTANKAREHLHAILYWAWEQELIDAPPRFPSPRDQRDVAGRHYLTKPEIHALYFAPHKMERPRGWDASHPIGRYWRAALVVFFNYGVDTGTVWGSTPAQEPILWRHVIWDRKSPDREAKEQSPWGWLFYRRVKTDKAFYRPMNRVVHAHLKSLMSEGLRPDAPVFEGGGARPNARFEALCGLGGIRPRLDIETGREEPWELKDLWKTRATYHDEHVPESSVEILGHSVGGITHRHYAHQAPPAFRAIMTLPQPSAFSAILRGGDSECPCCRRRFADAGSLGRLPRQIVPCRTIPGILIRDSPWIVRPCRAGVARVPDLFARTPWDRPPSCDRCGRLESECSCAPPAPEAKRISPHQQTARLTTERRAKGKTVTVIAGLNPEANDLDELGTRLKGACGAGGTVKGGRIELQGNHLQAAEEALQAIGYKTRAGRG